MKSFDNLPDAKQDELYQITNLLSSIKGVEMVLLFGSYARGEWVEDFYQEKGTTYEYRSDFDLLVVQTHDDLHQRFRIEDQIKSDLIDTKQVKTPVSLIFHGIKQLNTALASGNYFFKDIQQEGIVLYDSEKFKLATPKKLSPQQYQQKAQEHFDKWFKSANGFLKQFGYALKDAEFHIAAFQLHQATERFFTTVLLVFTDYRPKDHNLENLRTKAIQCDARLDVFPRNSDEDKRLFDLLKKAYIDARYKMEEYQITAHDLEQLSAYVEKFKLLTEEVCKEKIRLINKYK